MTANNNPYNLKHYRHHFNLSTPEGIAYSDHIVNYYGRDYRLSFPAPVEDLRNYLVRPHAWDWGSQRGTPEYERIVSKVEPIDNDGWERDCERLFRRTWLEPHWDLPEIPGHYAHVIRDKDNAILIEFVASEAHGRRGRMTTMKPGRYLTRYYSALSADEVRAHATQLDKAETVNFAVTPDEIEWVYVNGPSSCMSYTANHFASSEHPVRVYGDSDLQVAYLMRRGKVSARVLVWPAKKVYSTIYGDSHRLAPALEALGYRGGGFDEAKIRLVPDANRANRIILPYIDGYSRVDIEGDAVIIREGARGALCGMTNGLSEHDPGEWCSYTEAYHPSEDMIYCEDEGDSYHISALEDGYIWQDSATGDCYRSEEHRLTLYDGQSIHREAYDRYNGFYCAGSEEHYINNQWMGARFTPVTLEDTEETVSLHWAKQNAFPNGTGGWLRSEPEDIAEAA